MQIRLSIINGQMNKSTLVIPNVFEFNTKSIASGVLDKYLNSWREVGTALADLAIFWPGEYKIIASRRLINSHFVEYITNKLNYKQIRNYSPSVNSRDLFNDILEDNTINQLLINELQNQESDLITWGTTKGVYKFCDTLNDMGIKLDTPDTTSRSNYWAVLYIDSKAGFRHICCPVDPQIISMPRGFVCNLSDALEYIRTFYNAGDGCFIKSNIGVGGVGLIPLNLEWKKHSDKKFQTYIDQETQKMPYLFDSSPIVVEQKIRQKLVRVDSNTIAGAFFVNLFIHSTGEVELLGGGCELRNNHNHYVGAQMGIGSVFDQTVAHECEKISRYLCQLFASLGYQGNIGFDYLLDENDKLYVLEANPRRCSEAHIYDLATRLFDTEWRSHKYVLTRLPLRIKATTDTDANSVIDLFADVGCELGKGVDLFLTCISWLDIKNDPGLGYVILGPDKYVVDNADLLLHHRLAEIGLHPY